EAGAARVFNLARTDVAGYREYARSIARMFRDNPQVLVDLMEGLFHIAMADGFYHPSENAFLEDVAGIFGLDERTFRALRARFVPQAQSDPYAVLGVTRDMPLEEIRKVWRQLVRETHPDAMIARGVPEEAVRLAEKRLVAINRAWDEINGAA
ncbi:MAG TPA: molecular chaperone DjiA, partial [Thermopetrobacter sp.]|nr:molecular chaperone DjiA [Thermopetrobacter sp.]